MDLYRPPQSFADDDELPFDGRSQHAIVFVLPQGTACGELLNVLRRLFDRPQAAFSLELLEVIHQAAIARRGRVLIDRILPFALAS
jgi:hypothetical protein